jgi:hypothetical protein
VLAIDAARHHRNILQVPAAVPDRLQAGPMDDFCEHLRGAVP